MSRFVHSIQALALAWGAPGILIVAFLDSSVLSLPEIADLLVVYMVTTHPARLAVYVSCATIGSLVGCLALYYIGKGGEALLRSRMSTHRYDKTLSAFRRHGIMAVLVPSLLPPPAPFKPFVLLAGVAEISVGKFTTAILIGRGARYLIEGLLALWYGERAIAYIREHGVQVGVTAIVLVLVGFVVYLRWPRQRH
ncbi:MAG TPA: VTT domain-containing protein [Vicinamibacterales bacterium]|nr:VTT domain-containing protein [Vicinamibacterales bacterium]